MRTHTPLKPQRGAALVTALVFLVILTILGLAAMRFGRVDLRLTLNEESRVDAVQYAQSAVDAYAQNLNVAQGSGYAVNCYIGRDLDATLLSQKQGFSCAANTDLLPENVSNFSSANFKPYTYASVFRESINGADFAPMSVLRTGDSGSAYQLASFSIIGGYDRSGAGASTAQLGAAEVQQGVYQRVANVRGLAVQ